MIRRMYTFTKKADGSSGGAKAAKAVAEAEKMSLARLARDAQNVNTLVSLGKNVYDFGTTLFPQLKPKPSIWQSIGQTAKDMAGKSVIGLGIVGGYALTKAIQSIRNDTKRRQVFDSLAADPDFKNVDKAKLLEWYATIQHYAPNTTLDKVATKAILKQFVTFGTVDLQTIKSLAEIQKAQGNALEPAKWVEWAVK